MPDNPDHSGDDIPLTSQGWNWSFADAQEAVAACGGLEIGQTYKTADDKTHVLIELSPGRTSPMLGVGVHGTVDVDWGDGTAHDTLTGTDINTLRWTPTHNYARPGAYDIKLSAQGTMCILGQSSGSQYGALMRHSIAADDRNSIYRNSIKSVYCADNVIVGGSAFRSCFAIENVVVPNGALITYDSVFRAAYNLSYFVFPAGPTEMLANMFYNAYSARVCLSDNVESIYAQAFYNCYAMGKIYIGKHVKTINSQAFYNCTGAKEYHFMPTSPPNLAMSNAFDGISPDCVMYVPYSEDHSILNAYKTATNWSAYASYMQEEPQ